MSRFFKSAAFPIVIVMVLAFFAQKLISPGADEKEVSYSDFTTQLENRRLKTVELRQKDNTARVLTVEDKKYEVGFLDESADTLERTLTAAKAEGKIQEFDIKGRKTNGWISVLTYALPFLLFIGLWIFLMNSMQGGGSKVMQFGKSKAKRLSADS
ncbi:MAG: ATP-dependent metallopeptidase FtsH/Yme1/Tma family protein, partial [Actinomycetota bacterium]|nr:ATP-dependent metallopeptidase FtsH/Yme1/Tma family protein [Actinomycetota bacterium]